MSLTTRILKLFLSTGDQREQPFVQVAGIVVRDGVAAIGSGWHRLADDPHKFRDGNRTNWPALLWLMSAISEVHDGMRRYLPRAAAMSLIFWTSRWRLPGTAVKPWCP